ncbi:uncharacterized protein LOC120282874 [Dioscorea cayenensis subsp. rotundata]|uniref:Uncharacterized protein LOC120282874 n=1 Tax=Dioscorea cayennensis subsp. rotundata TaxID=55577 RepID=A0AB40D051_DIOCR|nr:uncharacterized protein LOC120282874 [Dioscorea cayenensis subsp. rotundata]
MDMFYGVAKYKGDGYVLDFTVLTGWLTLFEEMCTYWAFEPPTVRVKYIMPDEHKTICSISSEDDFQNMCNVHRIFKKTVVNMIIDTVNETTEAILTHGGAITISNSLQDTEAEIFMVGQRFENAQEFKDSLCDLAINRNFNFRFIKNDKDRVTVTCAAELCQWRVHASRDRNLPTFRIKTTQNSHTCGGGIGTTSHPRASKKWVRRQVMRKLRDHPLYRAVDIQRDILCDHGVRIPYKQAWMGKEVAKGILHGSDVASHDLLIWYASKVSETNPSSIVIIEKDGERFKRGKYGGILLGATAKDGNEGLFHLAFAIVDNETDDNLTWLISTLGDAIYGEDDYHKIITFISDRSKGLVNAIAKVFPSAPHEYDATVGALSAASTQAHNWLFQKSDMMHWCNYLFRGQRWGEMYLNVAESFNAWIREARHLPVCNMVDTIRCKMMNLMYKRRENSMKWETHLCPEIHKKIEKTIEESRCLVIGRSDGDIFEVVDKQGNHATTQSQCTKKHMRVQYSLYQITTNRWMRVDISVFVHLSQRRDSDDQEKGGLNHKHLVFVTYIVVDATKLGITGPHPAKSGRPFIGWIEISSWTGCSINFSVSPSVSPSLGMHIESPDFSCASDYIALSMSSVVCLSTSLNWDGVGAARFLSLGAGAPFTWATFVGYAVFKARVTRFSG